MIRVYGASDDLVEIEGSKYREDEIGCFDADVRLSFTDGTVVLVSYPKPGAAIWGITVEKVGSAEQRLHVCIDETAPIYSDIFEIDAEIAHHELIDQR